MAQSRNRDESKELIQDLCNLEVPSVIRVSPDTKHVLYATNLSHAHKKGKHAVSTLWLATTGLENSSKQLTSGNVKDYHPRWHPDGNSIAFISDRAKPGEQWAIYLWYCKNGVPFGEPHAITDTDNERTIASFEFSPDGKYIGFLCADAETAEHKARKENGEDWNVWGEEWVNVRLRTIDLETKKVVRHAGESQGSKEFNDHVTALCWHSDSRSLAVVHTRTSHIEEPFLSGSKISLVKLSSAETSAESTEAWSAHELLTIPNAIPSIAWGPEEKLYFIGGTPIDKTCGGSLVYSISIESGKPQRVAFGAMDDAKEVVALNGEVLTYVEHGLHDNLVMLPSNPLFSIAQSIQAFHAGFSPGSDEVTLAICTSDVNTPPEVYSTTASSGDLVRLSNHGARFRNDVFGSCHLFSCRSRDDEVDLDGVFLTPGPALPHNPQPAVVLIHGGPTARSTNGFDAYLFYWTPFLLLHGYSVVLTNYRGSSGKGEAFASYSFKGVGKVDYDDVVTITNRAIELKYANKDRLIVGGISQGGFLSYLCSTRNGSLYPWKFRAAMPLNGVTDTDTMALTSDVGASLETELNAGRSPWNMPKNFTGNRQASAIWEVDAAVQKARKENSMIIPPMLIMHSGADERCPHEQGVGMRRALTYHGLPYEFVTYPRQEHILLEQKFWIDMAER